MLLRHRLICLCAALLLVGCAELEERPEFRLPPLATGDPLVSGGGPVLAVAPAPEAVAGVPVASVPLAAAVSETASVSVPSSDVPPPYLRAPTAVPVVPETVGDLFDPRSAKDHELSCAEFFAMLKTEQPSSVEEALRGIAKIRPQYLTRTVFGYQTKNPYDDATPIFPRSWIYGGDAKMILGFGGRHRGLGFERLEAMCFDDQENKFDTYDIVFPKEAPSPKAIADLTETERQLKHLVIPGGRGQRECKNCHQTPLRPDWDTYALWPGFYGAFDDTLKDHDRPDSRATYATFEYNDWLRFQSKPAQLKRYALISQELIRPNSDFTLHLSYLNGRRIIGDLNRLGPAFEPHKYEFAKALLCTPRAERRAFRQLNGESSVTATMAVLPEGVDADTKDIFLSSYYDEMQREKRLGEILNGAGIPSPLPKEHFESLRAYYRDLFQDKELNLDMRLSSVDVDEILLVRELKRVTDKLDVDIENWSMVRDGAFVHENGLGGEGKESLRLILERPFVNTFLTGDPELTEWIHGREATENLYFAPGGAGRTPLNQQAIEAANSKICGELGKRTR